MRPDRRSIVGTNSHNGEVSSYVHVHESQGLIHGRLYRAPTPAGHPRPARHHLPDL